MAKNRKWVNVRRLFAYILVLEVTTTLVLLLSLLWAWLESGYSFFLAIFLIAFSFFPPLIFVTAIVVRRKYERDYEYRTFRLPPMVVISGVERALGRAGAMGEKKGPQKATMRFSPDVHEVFLLSDSGLAVKVFGNAIQNGSLPIRTIVGIGPISPENMDISEIVKVAVDSELTR